jgi:hypothetical protein
VFFLIDALDDCLDVRVRRQFLIWIGNLLNFNLNFNNHTNIKVLATTRHDDKFGKAFLSKGLTMEIKASREDVEIFLECKPGLSSGVHSEETRALGLYSESDH